MLDVKGFSYEDRGVVVPALLQAISGSGCWLLDRQMLTVSQMEILFEMQLRSALGIYSDLIGAGLELTRAGHGSLTGLCTLCKHNPQVMQAGRMVTVRLHVSFLEEEYEGLAISAGGFGTA